MSDIRFNRWLHNSGTGGVTQDSSGNIGIGSSVPRTALDVVGIISATSFTGNVTGNATGLSGTPNITVGNIIASSATISGNVSVAGTLTYEDVTNVDSLGIVTARTGVRIDAGGLVVVGVTTVAAGSAAAPSITPTGDSNTGIFFPSADTIAFGEGGAEALRIDSSGNVGIGLINPTEKLQVDGTIKINDGGAGNNATAFGSYKRLLFDNSYNDVARGPNKITMYNDGNTWAGGFGIHDNTVSYYSGGTHKWYKVNNQTSFTETLSIDSSGRVKMPYQPAFLAYNSTGVSVNGGWYNLSSSMTAEAYDIGGNYGTSTAGRFVAPVAGRYLFYFGGYGNGSTIDARYAVSATVNGGSQFYISGGNYSLADTPLSGYSVIHNLSVNDYVELFYFSAIANTWGGGSHYVYWGGYLLG